MNGYVAAALVIIILGIVYSYVRQVSYSLVASVTCGGVFAILVVTASPYGFLASETGFAIAFSPRDVTDPSMFYTVLTSMYAHADPYHLIFNLLVVAFICMIFEQRIGTRPFIILYLLCGLAGTLLFTALRWSDPDLVVGASGAISGVLGAFARLYPHERMTFVFFPLFQIPLWVVVAGFLVLQLFLLSGQNNVAVEAHIGGLMAGLLLAPLIVKMPVRRRVRRAVSLSALRRMATTPELKAILRNIEDEEFPDVRSAWIEEFLRTAKCPQCGAGLRVTREAVMCEKGHML